jgi:fucose 4-O-acetylase-like acetyltransferase
VNLVRGVEEVRVTAAPTVVRGPGSTWPAEGRAPRLVYLDNVRALLIAGIIAAHALMGYSAFGSWTYQDVREGTISEPLELTLIVPAAIGSLFFMGLFFLIAGLQSHDAMARKRPRGFALDRLVRLGIPYAVSVLVLWPVLEYLLVAPILHEGPYLPWFLHQDPPLDTGPMWFVGVLLLFSLVYAGWVHLRGPVARDPRPMPRSGSIVAAIVAIGLATFVVRLAFPLDSEQILQIHLWQWPQCIASFGLGIVAASRGWLRPVEDAWYRRAGVATVGAVIAMVASIGVAVALGDEPEDFFGGRGPYAFVYAMLEGVLVVAGSVWVLAIAQRHLDATGPLRAALARSSYAAYIVQGPVLVGLALLLRPTSFPIDAKALLVAALGVVGSFASAWILVTRTALRRVL